MSGSVLRPRKLLHYGAVLILAWCAMTSVLYMGYLASYPFQVECREGAQVRSTLALAEGRNPWAAAYAPQDFNCYGVLYPGVAALLLPPGHRGVRSLRILSLAALLLAAALLGAAAGRLARSRLAGAAAGMAALGGYLFFVTPTARCDGFAALFFAAPLALLELWPGRWGLALAVLLAVAAFFTKPYAALAGPAIVLWLAGQQRWRAGLTVGLVWVLLLGVAMAVVEGLWPGYLESTLWLHANAAMRDVALIELQTRGYVIFAWPLALLAAFGAWRFGLARAARAWLLPMLLVAGVLEGWLGWHPGADLQYYLQLMQPCALLAGCALWATRPREEYWLETALVLAAWIAVYSGTVDLSRFSSINPDPWRRAETLLRSARQPLADSIMTSVMTDHGLAVADNGQTEYLDLAGRGTTGPALRAAARNWRNLWQGRLDRGELDLVFLRVGLPEPPLLRAHYRLQEQLNLPEPVELGLGVVQLNVYVPLGPAAHAPAQGSSKGFPSRRSQ
jgi:hypothetical protein